MPWCVTVRRFGGSGGEQLLIGQLVEIPDGTRLRQLIEQGYVRLATPKEVDTAEEVEVDEPAPPPPLRKPLTVRRPTKNKTRR